MRFFETCPVLLVCVYGIAQQRLFLEDFLRLVRVIPEIRLRGVLNQLVDSVLFARDVKDASREGRAFLRADSVVRGLLQT